MSNKSESIQFGPPKMSRCSNGRLYAVRINCLNVLAVRTNLPDCARPPLPASTDLFGFTEATSNEGRPVAAGVCANVEEAMIARLVAAPRRNDGLLISLFSIRCRMVCTIHNEHLYTATLRFQFDADLFL